MVNSKSSERLFTDSLFVSSCSTRRRNTREHSQTDKPMIDPSTGRESSTIDSRVWAICAKVVDIHSASRRRSGQ